MLRQVVNQTRGQKAVDGAGVHLVRVLGIRNTSLYDPFLMLDAFDSTDSKEFEAGFPLHPHRGIETVSFISKGQMLHRDHLGTEAVVHDGEAQWLTAGSGAEHEEWPGGKRLLGTQLWLNLPAKDKMTAPPAYHGISTDEIQEFPLEGGYSPPYHWRLSGCARLAGKVSSFGLLRYPSGAERQGTGSRQERLVGIPFYLAG